MNVAIVEPSTCKAALRMPAPSCPSGEPDLAGLLTRVAAGEQRAFERFYQLTVGRIFGLALRIVRCHATAQEVAENVYVQIWHSAASYDAKRGTPLGWMLTICRSRAIDALRRADTAVVDPDPTERIDAISEEAPATQDLLEASQQHAALHAAISRLRPEQRQLLSLAFFRGMTHQEIAQASGLPLGTVKSTIRRSLTVLREELGTV